MRSSPRIILTREREQNRPWAERLRAQGFSVLELPLLRFVPIAPAPGLNEQSFDWILFTSPQGVRAFCEAGLQVGKAKLGTLGEGTAKTLREAGLNDSLGVQAPNGRELALAFAVQVTEGARVLVPGPRRRGAEVEDILTAAGCDLTMAPLYETLPVPLDDLPAAPFAADDVVLFCSPSTVRAFCAKWTARPDAVAIGETTAAVTRQEGFPTFVAESPDLDAMIRAAGLDPFAAPNPECES